MGVENNNSVASAPATTDLDKTHDALVSHIETYIKDPQPESLKSLQEIFPTYKTTRENYQKSLTEFQKAQEAANQPPADYVFELPKDSKVDASFVDQIKAYAKENKLSLAAAKAKFENDYSAVSGWISQREAQSNKQLETMKASLTAHPVLGGANLPQTNELVTRFIETFGPKDYMAKFQRMGANFDADTMEMIYKAAQAISPEKLIMPKQGTVAPKAGEVPGRKIPAGFSEIKTAGAAK